MGGQIVWELMFANDFVKISLAPERLQKLIEKALPADYTREWRVTANVNKCGILRGTRVNNTKYCW